MLLQRRALCKQTNKQNKRSESFTLILVVKLLYMHIHYEAKSAEDINLLLAGKHKEFLNA